MIFSFSSYHQVLSADDEERSRDIHRGVPSSMASSVYLVAFCLFFSDESKNIGKDAPYLPV